MVPEDEPPDWHPPETVQRKELREIVEREDYADHLREAALDQYAYEIEALLEEKPPLPLGKGLLTVMAAFGWSSPAMLDAYVEDTKQRRAAAKERGEGQP